jgi:hydrogenase nickel incorporation protein HypA/HybF
MHELAICQELMTQLEQAAAPHHPAVIERVLLSVGALSGVEPALLKRAFEIARAGTLAADAELEIQTGPVRVRCTSCGQESDARANRLLCAPCGDWRVKVIAGEELLLLSLDLSTAAPPRNSTIHDRTKEVNHV